MSILKSEDPRAGETPRPANGAEATTHCEWLNGSCCSSDVGERVVGDLTWFRVGLALAFAGQGMVFGLGYNLALEAGETPAFGSSVYWALHGGLLFSAVAVIALLGVPLIRSTWLTLKAREWTVEPLFLLTATGALLASLLSTAHGSGSVYYEVVGLVLVIYTVGRKVGAATRTKAVALTKHWQDGLGWAHIETPLGNRQRVPVSTIDANAVVIVLPEELVTVDGRIVEGVGHVRETIATGELRPIRKGVGDMVYAGSHVVDAAFKIAPLIRPEGRMIDQILRTVDEASARPSRFQSEADRLMRWFLPGVMAASVLTFAVWWLIGLPWPDALFHAMAVLLVACPCALGLATPIAVWNGLLALSKRGLVSRDGRLLDGLAECEVWLFDKTGTLSEVMDGDPALEVLVEDFTKEWLGAAVASIESLSRHPLAGPLQRLSGERLEVSRFETVEGSGVRAHVEGRRLRVGHGKWLGCDRVGTADRSVFVEVDGRLAAKIDIGEQLQANASSALWALKESGRQVRILSGDPSTRLKTIGGVKVEGGLLPQEKVDEVRGLVRSGQKVVFVGDGINDAGAMAEASIGVAMAKGASLTQATATGILLNGNLEVLPWAILFCHKLKERLRGNLIFALSYNVIGISLAASGHLHPVLAALLMFFSSLIVSWRAAHLVDLKN